MSSGLLSGPCVFYTGNTVVACCVILNLAVARSNHLTPSVLPTRGISSGSSPAGSGLGEKPAQNYSRARPTSPPPQEQAPVPSPRNAERQSKLGKGAPQCRQHTLWLVNNTHTRKKKKKTNYGSVSQHCVIKEKDQPRYIAVSCSPFIHLHRNNHQIALMLVLSHSTLLPDNTHRKY